MLLNANRDYLNYKGLLFKNNTVFISSHIIGPEISLHNFWYLFLWHKKKLYFVDSVSNSRSGS